MAENLSPQEKKEIDLRNEQELINNLFQIGFHSVDFSVGKGNFRQVGTGYVIDVTNLSSFDLNQIIKAAMRAGAYQRGEEFKKLCNM